MAGGDEYDDTEPLAGDGDLGVFKVHREAMDRCAADLHN